MVKIKNDFENIVKTEQFNVALKILKNEKKSKRQLIEESLTNEGALAFIKIFYNSNLSIKVFWALSLILSNCACAYLTMETIFTYLSYGVNSSTRNIVENPTDFPKITLCNNNQFTTDYAVEFIRKVNLDVDASFDIFNFTQMSEFNATDKYDKIFLIYNAAVSAMLSPNVSNSERKQLGHSLDDILFSCTFNNQPCTSDDFVWKFDRYYGNCYVFNSGYNSSGHKVEIKKSLISGSLYGLQIQVYIGYNDKLSLFNSIYGKGGFIKVENSSYLLDDTLDGIFLAPGRCFV